MSLSSSAIAVLPAITAPADAKALADKTEQFEVRLEPFYKGINSEDYQPIADSKNVEKFLKDYFTDIPILAKIGGCESRNRHLNSRGQVLRGEKNTFDRGVMQINILYHEETAAEMGLDLHDLDDNVAYARYLYEKQGSKPWKSSSACWSKFALTPSAEIAKK